MMVWKMMEHVEYILSNADFWLSMFNFRGGGYYFKEKDPRLPFWGLQLGENSASDLTQI